MTRPASRSLLKILGLSFGLAVTVGNSIGGGILRAPGDVAALLPNPIAFIGIWVVGATYALLGANAMAELGTMIPRSGGQYVFVRRAFGDYAGFVIGWIDWISTCASVAAIAIVIGESVAAIFGWPRVGAVTTAVAIVIVFTILLMRGTRVGDAAQQLTSVVKTLALGALVVACLTFGGGAHMPPVAVQPVAATSAFVAFMLAAQAVIYTYDGWTGSIYFSEELDDPARQIPRSMFYGLITVAVIYLAMNLAFLRVAPTSVLAGSELAAGVVANAIFGARGELIVRLIVIVSLPSAVNACLLMASRTLYSVSRDGLGLGWAVAVNAGGTPYLALVASGLVAIGFLATGTFETIIAIAAFFFVADYLLSFLAVFALRAREPNTPRPYRAVGHPWTTGLVCAGSAAFLVSAVFADARHSVVALVVLAASLPVFRLTRARV